MQSALGLGIDYWRFCKLPRCLFAASPRTVEGAHVCKLMWCPQAGSIAATWRLVSKDRLGVEEHCGVVALRLAWLPALAV